jgi:hypothetical protein
MRSAILSSLILTSLVAAPAFAQEKPDAAPKPAKPDAKPAAKPAKPAGKRKAGPPTWPDETGLYNIAQTTLGATASQSGAPFNKDWPAINAIQGETETRGGTMFGAPMAGARINIRLAVPATVKAIEVVQLDYHGTMLPKGVDILIDDKKVTHVDLPELPDEPFRIPVEGKGQVVSLIVTDTYPERPPEKEGGKQLNYGGFKRIRVLSPDNIAALMTAPAAYTVEVAPNNIAPTSGALADGEVKVNGQPRQAEGHPNTLWDKQDIEHYKAMLKTSPELQKQFAQLKKAMDERITRPVGVPEPQKDDKGEWKHLTGNGVDKIHNERGLDIANLGTVYALSGEEKYGEFAKKILLAYAEAYPNYGVGARPGFAHDPSKVFDQRLSDATWLIQVARGYDLIYNLSSISSEERKQIEDDLLKASAKFIAANSSTMKAATNWSAICTNAVLIVGYATDDQSLVDLAMYGPGGTKDKPTGGVNLHFSNKSIDDDGMWAEGSTGYQMMAMEALISDAEILWRHNIDMYRYRDGALKRLFDSPIRYAYPNLRTPAVHDGGGGSIVGYESNLWEYGYLRYGDPMYLLILNQVPMNLGAQFQKFPVSVLFDRDRSGGTPPIEWKSVNFFGVGFGINRLTTDKGTISMLLDWGPNRSHGHPDKLNVDLYAFGDRLIPDPGSIWYEQPLYKNWYHTTVAHNTLNVDELEQQPAGAKQIVYAPAETMSLQRATTDEAYSGVTMDRALFLTPEYMADSFGAFAQTPHKLDLSWHLVGKFDSALKLDPFEFPEPKAQGYAELANTRHATTDQPWSASITAKGGVARFVAAGGIPTEVIVGDGHLGTERPPTILQRRDNTASTIYGNVVDISGDKDPYVKTVASEGSLENGYSLLKIQTTKGVDLGFTSYRAGTQKLSDIETDAQQALVTMDGNTPRGIYLGGGTLVKVGDVVLRRSEPGLAYVEKSVSGAYLVGNPSPREATVSLTFKPLSGMQAFQIDNDGKRTGPVEIATSGDANCVLKLPPAGRVEIAAPGAASGFEFRQNQLKKRQEAQQAAEAAAKAEAIKRSEARTVEAAAHPAPPKTSIVVQAEAFTGRGGGDVRIIGNKVATSGACISGWDAINQWVEWTVEVPADGSYNLWACFCTQQASGNRNIAINGEDAGAPLALPTTGGWSNGTDDWQLLPASDPINNQPLFIKLKKGSNTIRLTNTDGNGVNLDYLVITSPDVKPDRLPAEAPAPGTVPEPAPKAAPKAK